MTKCTKNQMTKLAGIVIKINFSYLFEVMKMDFMGFSFSVL